jgi:hypothetical protein
MTSVAEAPAIAAHVPVSAAASGPELRRKYDMLRVGGIPARRMAVVGHDLRWAERVGPGAALKAGALGGGALGAIVTLVLWATGYTTIGTGAIPVAAIGGAVAGALVALAAQRRGRLRGGIADGMRLEAERYELLVDPERAPRAREVLERYGR